MAKDFSRKMGIRMKRTRADGSLLGTTPAPGCGGTRPAFRRCVRQVRYTRKNSVRLPFPGRARSRLPARVPQLSNHLKRFVAGGDHLMSLVIFKQNQMNLPLPGGGGDRLEPAPALLNGRQPARAHRVRAVGHGNNPVIPPLLRRLCRFCLHNFYRALVFTTAEKSPVIAAK